ncbi:ATP synthase gamma chain [Variibacter gotjawalensis]|uniref:ATP synthase gamma chain n=1 Tax=Variibacter gotjawalensis TaxID=1333996 RepID=A0A0S3PRS5_9BRAD|nr:F0F1 ATP synthase subunit gamma [Variibacter gotjawalensis]NIK48956.1 F-type H+-transporting ATPase subunit gamma [Variibacter gotjawalensis]RZS50812.1 ATP synthase F1 subcomplex gamma subunit [Variibacter gotjawalensis]BAT58646.1 ATP synthase gamma chain [Variibacter gotjawalensis]
MASLKDMRNRIASTKATQKITKAMQMVAASKLRRAQQAVEVARPYAERIEAVLGNIAASVAGQDGAPRLLSGTGQDKTHLLIVCTAERGLCGAFNSQIVRLAREHINRLVREGKEVKIQCVGRKGADQLRRQYSKLMLKTIELRGVRSVGFENAREISEQVVASFDKGEFDIATLFYSRFKSVISQIPTAQQIIPAAPPVSEGDKKTDAPAAVYEYEPAEEEILAELLPAYLTTQIYRALLENAASEQGARMSAMDNATRNAGEMIRKQTLTYNRTRQAMITKELIEIISGAEAL